MSLVGLLIVGSHLEVFKASRLVLIVWVGPYEIRIHIINTALGVHQKLIWLTFDLYLLHHNVIDHVDRFTFFIIFSISLKHTFIITKIARRFFQLKLVIFVILADIELTVFVSGLKISFCIINICVLVALWQYFKTRLAS